MLSDEQIREFQALYEKHFDKRISRKDALEKGIKLIRLIELIYSQATPSKNK